MPKRPEGGVTGDDRRAEEIDSETIKQKIIKLMAHIERILESGGTPIYNVTLGPPFEGFTVTRRMFFSEEPREDVQATDRKKLTCELLSAQSEIDVRTSIVRDTGTGHRVVSRSSYIDTEDDERFARAMNHKICVIRILDPSRNVQLRFSGDEFQIHQIVLEQSYDGDMTGVLACGIKTKSGTSISEDTKSTQIEATIPKVEPEEIIIDMIKTQQTRSGANREERHLEFSPSELDRENVVSLAILLNVENLLGEIGKNLFLEQGGNLALAIEEVTKKAAQVLQELFEELLRQERPGGRPGEESRTERADIPTGGKKVPLAGATPEKAPFQEVSSQEVPTRSARILDALRRFLRGRS